MFLVIQINLFVTFWLKPKSSKLSISSPILSRPFLGFPYPIRGFGIPGGLSRRLVRPVGSSIRSSDSLSEDSSS